MFRVRDEINLKFHFPVNTKTLVCLQTIFLLKTKDRCRQEFNLCDTKFTSCALGFHGLHTYAHIKSIQTYIGSFSNHPSNNVTMIWSITIKVGGMFHQEEICLHKIPTLRQYIWCHDQKSSNISIRIFAHWNGLETNSNGDYLSRSHCICPLQGSVRL